MTKDLPAGHGEKASAPKDLQAGDQFRGKYLAGHVSSTDHFGKTVKKVEPIESGHRVHFHEGGHYDARSDATLVVGRKFGGDSDPKRSSAQGVEHERGKLEAAVQRRQAVRTRASSGALGNSLAFRNRNGGK